MVKRSWAQSTDAPMRRIWLVMVLPECSFQRQMRSSKALRPSAWRVRPSALIWRSTTIWVAMPAWSVPGCHSVRRPFIRW